MSNNMFIGEGGVKHLLSKIKKLDTKFLNMDWIPESYEVVTTIYSESAEKLTSSGINFYPTTTFEIIAGETYRITWDGITYECVGRSKDLGDGIQVYELGNNGIGSDDETVNTGEPFYWYIGNAYTENSIFSLITNDTYKGKTIAISIEHVKREAVEKLPNEFLGLDWIPVKNVTVCKVWGDSIELSSVSAKTFTTPFEIYNRTTYEVTFNNTKYECVGIVTVNSSNTGRKDYFLGNLSLIADNGSNDTGEPFVMFYQMQGTQLFNMTLLCKQEYKGTTVEIEVASVSTVLKKMPIEFLPSEVTEGVSIEDLSRTNILKAQKALKNGCKVVYNNCNVLHAVCGETEGEEELAFIDSNGLNFYSCGATFTTPLVESEGLSVGHYLVVDKIENGRFILKSKTLNTYTKTDVDNKFAEMNDQLNNIDVSWNSLKNKPFYEKTETKTTTILPEATYEYIGGGDDCAYIDTDFTIETGKTYTVLIGGEEIECVPQPFTATSKSGETFETLALVFDGNGGSGSLMWIPKESRYLADNHVSVLQLVGYDFTISILGETEVKTIVYLDPRFIKDMYYEEGGESGGFVEVLPETTAVDVSSATETSTLVYQVGDPTQIAYMNYIPITDGATYIVKYNGVEYNCVAVAVEEDGFTLYCLGDVYLMFEGEIGTESTGEPFVLMFFPEELVATEEFGMMGYILDGSTPNTLGIYQGGGKGAEIFPLTKAVGFDVMTDTDTLVYDNGTGENSEDAGMFLISPTVSIELEEGKSYVVSLNGVDYTTKAQLILVASGGAEGDVYALCLGDIYTLSGGEEGTEPTGEPFILMIPPSDFGAPYSAMGILMMEEYPLELELGIYEAGSGTGEKIIHRIPSKYIPTEIQGDWNENDENSLSYIKNRTHYEVVTKANEHIAEQVFDNVTIAGSIVYTGVFFDDFNIGDTYIIKFNGKEYICKAEQGTLENAGVYSWGIGNKSIHDPSFENTGEPFYIVNECSGSMLMFWKISEGMTATISAYTTTSTVKKLDSKFLPDSVNDPSCIEGMYYEKTILPESYGNIDNSTDGALYNLSNDGTSYTSHSVEIGDVKEGEIYTVTLNGVEYKCKAIKHSSNGYQYILLGDARREYGENIKTESTGEPFCIKKAPLNDPNAIRWSIHLFEGLEEITLSIKCVRQVDGKFVKDMYYDNHFKYTILEETVFNVGENPHPFIPQISPKSVIENDYSILLTLDGVEYRGKFKNVLGRAYTFGNLGSIGFGTDTGEPFILVYSGGETGLYYFGDNTDTFTVSICVDHHDIKKIDEKFLPDRVGIVDLPSLPKISIGASGDCYVCYGNNKFVALVPYDNILVSDDGLNWRVVEHSFSSNAKMLTFINDKFFITRGTSELYYSEDGENWTQLTSIPSISLNTETIPILYLGNKYILLGTDVDSTSYYSEDLTTWTEFVVDNENGSDIESISYLNGVYLVDPWGNPSYYYSTDLVTWSKASKPFGYNTYFITNDDNKFIAMGRYKMCYSTNGVEWLHRQLSCLVENEDDIIKCNGKIFITDFDGYLFYSDDGFEWAKLDRFPIISCGICYGNNMYVAIGRNNDSDGVGLYISFNGKDWVNKALTQKGALVTDTIPNIVPKADWNQNDYKKPGYIHNRPFGSIEQTIFRDTLTASSELTTKTYKLYENYLMNLPIAGNIYKVTVSGGGGGAGEYHCICQEDKDKYYFGNKDKLLGEGDTGEPFVITISKTRTLKSGTWYNEISHILYGMKAGNGYTVYITGTQPKAIERDFLTDSYILDLRELGMPNIFYNNSINNVETFTIENYELFKRELKMALRKGNIKLRIKSSISIHYNIFKDLNLLPVLEFPYADVIPTVVEHHDFFFFSALLGDAILYVYINNNGEVKVTIKKIGFIEEE